MSQFRYSTPKVRKTISLGPSHMNAMALVKGQTTQQGRPVVSDEYDPKEANYFKITKMDLKALAILERSFKGASAELRESENKVSPIVAAALKLTGMKK